MPYHRKHRKHRKHRTSDEQGLLAMLWVVTAFIIVLLICDAIWR